MQGASQREMDKHIKLFGDGSSDKYFISHQPKGQSRKITRLNMWDAAVLVAAAPLITGNVSLALIP